MNRYSVVWTEEAKGNLQDIFTYLIIRDSENSARRVLHAIDQCVYKIAFMPQKHPVEPVLKIRQYVSPLNGNIKSFSELLLTKYTYYAYSTHPGILVC